ncbi:D-hexose-6-phosphate mutarotase [Thalassotalea ponticola]|uniref:D-hexose-6-phosphate mutarotase n=1 Tax=Thalassotalea ponticola TaxID=1523392 RepID=UPI0025B3F481|nr:D-hexose-6-phosphate mutarotase [Thalassotalea ponticola]MDN3651721.1 D-hexose-6-phosphate mutarotase [Thalassotalea ponticola]
MIAVNKGELLISELERNEFGSIVQRTIATDIQIVELTHKNFSATISLYGGQVLSWKPNKQRDVFWLSKRTFYEKGKAIRGGIPLCWPWFGAHKDAGNHGFARNVNWQLDNFSVDSRAITIKLSLEGEQAYNVWPYKYRVVQTIVISDTFSQSLVVQNLSDRVFQFNGALHSYFQVSDPANVAVPGLNSHFYDDKISSYLNCPPRDVLDCTGPIDRIYHSDASVTLFDKVWKRAIEINKSNCPQWVLWNPGKDIALSMDDIHQLGENEFVCLEAANTNGVTVNPGKSAELFQEIQVYNL